MMTLRRQRDYDRWCADALKRNVSANPKKLLEAVEELKALGRSSKARREAEK